MQLIKKSLILFVLLFTVTAIDAQCFSFARTVGKAKLGEFIHDGNYNATVLSEGEKAELFKTFFEGQKYRVSISKIESLPTIHFRVVERSGKVIFDNSDHNYCLVWDFEVETTQMLIVEMQVLERKVQDDHLISGCVAVLFGIEADKKR